MDQIEQIGYLDLPSGLSGDMFLSCLLDAGWPLEKLQEVVRQLNLPETCHVVAEQVMRGPLRATLATVHTPKSQQHRHLHHVVKIIEAATLSDSVKQKAIAVFGRLADAEARVHGTTREKIHFHEVGALDAIIDITATCAGLEALKITRLHASAPAVGQGWVNTEHGRMPVPAPATAELLAAAGAPLGNSPGEGELLTPTAAALLAELADFSRPAMRLERVAVGAGQKQFAWPNIARLMLGAISPTGEHVIQLECNLDDMNPQYLPPLLENLLTAGALDVWLTDVRMKKGRPGWILGVLCATELEQKLTQLLMEQSSTLGVRGWPVHRHEASRRMEPVQTAFGEVAVKCKYWQGKLIGAHPEFEQCRKLAEAQGTGAWDVYQAAQAAAAALINKQAAATALIDEQAAATALLKK